MPLHTPRAKLIANKTLYKTTTCKLIASYLKIRLAPIIKHDIVGAQTRGLDDNQPYYLKAPSLYRTPIQLK